MGGAEIADLVAFPRAVDLGDAPECFRATLQDEVIDGKLHAFFLEPGVQLFAEGEERAGVDFDFDVEMRELGLRFDEPARDGSAHVRNLNGLLILNRTAAAEGADLR